MTSRQKSILVISSLLMGIFGFIAGNATYGRLDDFQFTLGTVGLLIVIGFVGRAVEWFLKTALDKYELIPWLAFLAGAVLAYFI